MEPRSQEGLTGEVVYTEKGIDRPDFKKEYLEHPEKIDHMAGKMMIKIEEVVYTVIVCEILLKVIRFWYEVRLKKSFAFASS